MAPVDRTARQEAIALILATDSPLQLYPILAEHPVARDPALIVELQSIAADLERFGQAGAAKHLGQVARCMRATFDRLEELARVTSREELLVLLRASTIAWAPGFYDLAEKLANEAETADPDRARLLRRGLVMRQEMVTGLEALDRVAKTPTTTYEALKSTAILRDPLFHEFVLLLAQNNVRDPREAEAFRRTIAGLAVSCRIVAEEEAQSGIYPLTFDEAGAWHRFDVSPALDEVMKVAASVAAKKLAALPQVVARLIGFATVDPTDELRVMLAMTFLENACRMEPQAAPLFLAEMRRVAGTHLEYPDRRVQATHALHYAMSLLLRWRSMPDTPNVLADAAQLLADVIPEVDAARGPRLASDLHWNRGQLLQNLGEWTPSSFADAISEFRIALNTPQRLQHEHVARALILSDLANALKQHHLYRGTLTREVEDERDGLYQQALQLLNAETEPLRRSGILGNAAIFLNERQEGDLGLNQERALEYVLEAIRLIGALGEDENPIIRARRAGLERTRGNILYSRLYGDPYEMAEAAIAAYDAALSYTDEGEHWLRGTIQFNRANSYARLARLDPRHEQTAYYAYEEAKTLFAGDRVTAAQASAAQASVMFTDASLRAVAVEQLREAISDVLSSGGTATAAPLLLQLGSWLVADAETPEQFQAAAATLTEAAGAHEQRADLAGAAHAALIASHALFSAGNHVEAVDKARRSVALSETVWSSAVSLEDRAAAGELWSSANAQLLCCLCTIGTLKPEEAWRLADQSKPPELSARIQQLARSSSGLDLAYAGFESEYRRLVAQRFRLQRERVTPDASLAGAIDALQDSAAGLDEMLSLVGRQQRSATAAEQANSIVRENPTMILIDISVAASGSIVLVADNSGTQVHPAPMTRGRLAKASSTWQAAYRNRRAQPEAWHRELDAFLAFVGDQLLSPVLSHLSPEQVIQSTLLFVPGILFGVPLHASPMDGIRVCQLPSSFAYAATIRGLSLRPVAPGRSLCILSDNETPPRQLQSPPREVTAIANALVSAGVHVTMVAQRGLELGALVFATAAIPLPEGVHVLEQRPTPERILELLGESDHVFYTGHGIGGAQHGLVVTDESGGEVLLSTLELLGAKGMRGRTLVLSACETAHEPVLASAEPMSIAASLLQLGAGFLLASSWVAIDHIAAELCTAFHDHWARSGWDPVRAFAGALKQVRASSNPTLSEWATYLPFVGVGS